jgi:hypothetical protein
VIPGVTINGFSASSLLNNRPLPIAIDPVLKVILIPPTTRTSAPINGDNT